MSELGHHHLLEFDAHAKKYGPDWLKQFSSRLGGRRSNSLYLLTGFYKTCSWSIASFGTQMNADSVDVDCTLVEEGNRIVWDDSFWHPAGRFDDKIGPPPGRQGKMNQTIFIRAIVITRKPSEEERSWPAYLTRLFSPSRFLNWATEDSTEAPVAEASKDDVIIQHVPKALRVSFMLHYEFEHILIHRL